MKNFYDPKRSISKAQLAKFAEVSPRTFSNYLDSRKDILASLGVKPTAKKLNPAAVQYVCEDYCIDLPANLQDQDVLSQAPKPLRDLIIKSSKKYFV